MNLKKIYYLVLCALVACTTASCKDSNDDYIPPALEPEKPEVPVEPEDPRSDVPIHVDGEPYHLPVFPVSPKYFLPWQYSS